MLELSQKYQLVGVYGLVLSQKYQLVGVYGREMPSTLSFSTYRRARTTLSHLFVEICCVSFDLEDLS